MPSTVLINEVSTNAGGPTQEAIEICNCSSLAVNIGGFVVRMVTPAAPAGPGVLVTTIPAGSVLPAGACYLVHGPSFALPTVGCSGSQPFNPGVGLPDSLSLGLLDTVGNVITGFGTVVVGAAGGLYTEGAPATPQSTATTLTLDNQRVPHCVDTGNNANDFRLRPPTFCATNSPV